MPVIIKPLKDVPHHKHNLMAILRAVIISKVRFKVLVKEDLSGSKVIQLSENNNKVNLSDCVRNISYSKVIEKGCITQIDLIKKIGLNKVATSRLLYFCNILSSVVASMEDITKIIDRTVSTIVSLSNKSSAYIINHIRILRAGKVDYKKSKKLIKLE